MTPFIKVSDVMHHVANHFIQKVMIGEWIHKDGSLTPSDALLPGAWIALADNANSTPSVVFQLDNHTGIPGFGDRQWSGALYLLDPPADFLRLCGDIRCWAAAFQHEESDPPATADWTVAFASVLARYKRVNAEDLL